MQLMIVVHASSLLEQVHAVHSSSPTPASEILCSYFGQDEGHKLFLTPQHSENSCLFDQLWKSGSSFISQHNTCKLILRNIKFDIIFIPWWNISFLMGVVSSVMTPPYRPQEPTECFDDDVNHLLWPSQSWQNFWRSSIHLFSTVPENLR